MGILVRGIVLLNFIVMLLAIPSVGVRAESKKSPINQDQVARKKITELERQLKAQSEQVNSLKTEVSENHRKQESQVQVLEQSVKDQTTEIESLKKQNADNSVLSVEGAIILLIGLLIEILGALLLGAPVLATKIEELSDFEIDTNMDMALHAPKKEAVLAFYSMIGHILLVLGFAAQFAGTAIVLSVGWTKLAFIVLGGVIFSLIILLRILGIDPTQTRKQKLTVVWKNILRVSKLKISAFMLRGRECEVCLKKVRKGKDYIFWYDQGNSQSHPYLHSPSQFLVGHEECVDKKIAQKIEAQANFEQRAKIQPHLQKMKGSDFVSTRVTNYKQWFAGHYDHWLKIRADWPKPSKQEVALDAAVAKIERINS